MEEKPKPRRRWYRFSLRTMFVAVTVVATIAALTSLVLEKYYWGPDRRFRQMNVERHHEILNSYNSLRSSIAKGDFKSGYQWMSPEYQRHHDLAEFKDFFTQNTLYEVLYDDDVFKYYESKEEGIATAMVIGRPKGHIAIGDIAGISTDWSRINGRWLMDRCFIFPRER